MAGAGLGRAARDVAELVAWFDGPVDLATLAAAAGVAVDVARRALAEAAAAGVLVVVDDRAATVDAAVVAALTSGIDPAAAAERLAGAGREALDRGALAPAVALLQRAVELSPPASDLYRHELLLALVAADHRERAEAVARELLAARADPVAQVRILLALARLYRRHDHDRATDAIAAARSLGAPALGAELDALDAVVTLEGGDPDRVTRAAALARRARDRALEEGAWATVAEAAEVVGRCERLTGVDAAERAFAEQLEAAERSGSTLLRLRALNELGTIDVLRRLDDTRLRLAVDAAVEAGALTEAAAASVNLAAAELMRYRLEEADAVARRAADLASSCGADALAGTATVMRAAVAARRADPAAMERLLAAAGVGREHPEDLRALTMCRIPAAMLADDREAALGLFQRAGALAARRPTLMTDPFHGMWLLVRLVAGTAGRDDLAVLDRLAPGSLWHAMHDGFARAIVAGRRGEADRAGTAFADGRRAAARYPMHEALYVRLVAEAALADGWGEPVAWLRDAEAWFVAHGHARSSAACRGLLKRAGAIVGRSGEQAESEVPADLRERGVTAREAEVLDLLGRRLTNREIAARLYLSPRTVEKHVASLLAKLGASSRRDLTHPPER